MRYRRCKVDYVRSAIMDCDHAAIRWRSDRLLVNVPHLEIDRGSGHEIAASLQLRGVEPATQSPVLSNSSHLRAGPLPWTPNLTM